MLTYTVRDLYGRGPDGQTWVLPVRESRSISVGTLMEAVRLALGRAREAGPMGGGLAVQVVGPRGALHGEFGPGPYVGRLSWRGRKALRFLRRNPVVIESH